MASWGLMCVPQKVLLMWSHKELIKHLSEAETEGKITWEKMFSNKSDKQHHQTNKTHKGKALKGR